MTQAQYNSEIARLTACPSIKPIDFWIAYRPYKPYPQILERIFVAEENKDNPYWSENGFKVRKFVEVVE
jgi:hypothetical protein